MWSSSALEQVPLVLNVGRTNRPRRAGKREQPEETSHKKALFGAKRLEMKRGVEYTVQTHSGASDDPAKTWTCPGCHILIQRGTPHIVAWSEDRGSDGRRHFHTVCWQKFQGTLL